MIGSALASLAAQNDIQVFALARRNSSKTKNIAAHPNITIMECDLDELQHLSLDQPCDAFFHLAWQSVGAQDRNNIDAQLQNVAYTLDAVRLAKRLECNVFVGAGSQAEYGRVEGTLNANTPISPENGYGIAKYTAGKMSRILCEQLSIRHTWARILSIYGPGDNATSMMMYCIYALLKGEVPQVTKCEQQWDYLHCKDAARALLAVAERGKDGRVYPIGSGKQQEMRWFIETLKDSIDPMLTVGYGQRAYNDNQVMRLCADIAQLEQDTGFRPEISFEEGIENTIAWCKEQI